MAPENHVDIQVASYLYSPGPLGVQPAMIPERPDEVEVSPDCPPLCLIGCVTVPRGRKLLRQS